LKKELPRAADRVYLLARFAGFVETDVAYGSLAMEGRRSRPRRSSPQASEVWLLGLDSNQQPSG
jgi:hypothetical protein